ncbi:Acidic phosphoprotein precursor PCEMA1, putative, partial [Plasmodium chabaudi adami]
FGFCRKKPKKAHKTTTDESVNVRGKGPYEEGYEEDYEEGYEEDYQDMIKDIFMPLKNNHQHSQNNSHKQDDAPPPVSKGPKKQKFTEKRQLRTINENKEICQKPKDLLCTDPEKDTKTESKSNIWYSTSEEIYEKNKHLLCTNPEETKEAEKLMNEAVGHLEQYATSIDGYESHGKSYGNFARYYKKKHEDHTYVLKANLTFEVPNKYDALLGILWDPDNANLFNAFVK